MEEFLIYLRDVKNYSELTIENYHNDLVEFFNFVNKGYESTTKEDVKKYLKYLFDKDNSNRTVSRKISTLKSFYRYLKDNDLVSANIMASIKYPKLERLLPKFINYSDLSTLFEISKSGEFGQRNNLIFELMYATGVRVSELVNIKISDIVLNDMDYIITTNCESHHFSLLEISLNILLFLHSLENLIARISCDTIVARSHLPVKI